MKITIIGNSVALRVRPPQDHPNNRNYTYLLKEKLGSVVTIENQALGATTIKNWLQFNDAVNNHFPDVFIIQIGVVDSTIREVPLWFYRLANRKVDNGITKIIRAVYRGPIARLRPILSKIRGSRPWISRNKFDKYYNQLISGILKETNAQIITLPINLANERIEKQLPGSRKNHEAYNLIIEEVTAKYQQHFLDLSDLNSEEHYPDGVHFNTKGHEIVTERLLSVLEKMK